MPKSFTDEKNKTELVNVCKKVNFFTKFGCEFINLRLMIFESKIFIQTTYPPDKMSIFMVYKVAVFFWILLGLVWLGGVVSLIR